MGFCEQRRSRGAMTEKEALPTTMADSAGSPISATDSPQVDTEKRRFLVAATSVVGGIGIVATAVPFVMSMWPSERAKAAGAPVEVDVSKIEAGQKIDVEWRGKVVWLVKRTPQMLANLPKLDPRLLDPKSNDSQQPKDCKNEYRSVKPELWVAV